MRVSKSEVKQTTREMRGLLLLASLLVVIIGTSAFFLPTRTDVFFAWTIGSPLTAAFLGGSYLAAFVLELLAAREVVWAYARVAVPAVFLFTTLTLIVTLLHLDKFHFDSSHWNTVAGTWVWLLVYLLVPFVMAALWIMQMRLEGGDPTHRASLPRWARITLLVQGMVMVLTGVWLLLFPVKIAAVWPWPLTPLTGRAIGAWGVGLGVAALHMARENSWRRGRAGFLASAVFALLQLVNLVRFGDEYSWGSPAGVLYLVLLLSLAVLGFIGWLRSRLH